MTTSANKKEETAAPAPVRPMLNWCTILALIALALFIVILVMWMRGRKAIARSPMRGGAGRGFVMRGGCGCSGVMPP